MSPPSTCDGSNVMLVDAQLGVTWTGQDDLVASARTGDTSWRCAPPALRVPVQTLDAVREVARDVVFIGPHPSTTAASATGTSSQSLTTAAWRAHAETFSEMEERRPRSLRELERSADHG